MPDDTKPGCARLGDSVCGSLPRGGKSDTSQVCLNAVRSIDVSGGLWARTDARPHADPHSKQHFDPDAESHVDQYGDTHPHSR